MTADNTAGTVVISPRWEAGREYTSLGSFTIGEALESGDTFTISSLLPVADHRVVAVDYFGAEFDTNATPTATITIGDGTDADGYMASQVAGNANGQLVLIGYGALHNTTSGAGADVVVTVGGSLATAASSGTGYVRIRYFCG